MTGDRPGFRVEAVEYAAGLPDLRAVREPVFVQEQRVPLELEWDALDPDCAHVIARDDAGRPIGTGRLTPERKIGRMAVLAGWRGRGVGDALLEALVDLGRQRGWPELQLNAQVSATGFYARHGFIPLGPRFEEAGIGHQAMRRKLDGAMAITTRDAAVAITIALATKARRNLWIWSHDLDPGLFDAGDVIDALRRLAVAGHGGGIRILLRDAAQPQRALAPLLPLAQRLPSVFQFREVDDPVDRDYPSAFVVNDAGGYYFRSLGNRFDGEADLAGSGRARQLVEVVRTVWERARPVAEYRALGI